MKWPLIFILSLLLFGFSYFYSQKNSPDSKTSKDSRISSEKIPDLNKASVKNLKNPKIKKRITPKASLGESRSDGNEENQLAQKPPGTLPHQLPINDPKHFALADSEGNLYPTNLGVDGDYVVAYGDVIVGSSANISEIESGEETVKVPKPEPWPGETLPYRLGDGLTESQKEAIVKIGQVLGNERIIKMRPYDPYKDKAYVYFKKGSNHCYAEVGYTGKVTQVALNERCGYGEIFHEVFHVLGFFHEQNRYDRDDYIKILWENINEEHWPQFEKFPKESFPEALQDPGLTPFSFYTFMLYRPTAFSNNNDFSIVNVSGDPYAQILEPTTEDFRRARLLYQRENP
jgi:hypothetical protein